MSQLELISFATGANGEQPRRSFKVELLGGIVRFVDPPEGYGSTPTYKGLQRLMLDLHEALMQPWQTM